MALPLGMAPLGASKMSACLSHLLEDRCQLAVGRTHDERSPLGSPAQGSSQRMVSTDTYRGAESKGTKHGGGWAARPRQALGRSGASQADPVQASIGLVHSGGVQLCARAGRCVMVQNGCRIGGAGVAAHVLGGASGWCNKVLGGSAGGRTFDPDAPQLEQRQHATTQC